MTFAQVLEDIRFTIIEVSTNHPEIKFPLDGVRL